MTAQPWCCGKHASLAIILAAITGEAAKVEDDRPDSLRLFDEHLPDVPPAVPDPTLCACGHTAGSHDDAGICWAENRRSSDGLCGCTGYRTTPDVIEP